LLLLERILIQRTSQKPPTRAFIQAPLRHGICKLLMQAMTELEDPAAQTLCEPARSKGTWTCHKSHFMREIRRKNPPSEVRCTFCASLRSRNALGHLKSSFMREFTGKMPALTPTVRTPLSVGTRFGE
jgi:hypothetical protein